MISLLLIGAGLFGQVTLREFAIALLVGMLTGAYSSIFVASPLLGWLKARSADVRRARLGTGDHLAARTCGPSSSPVRAASRAASTRRRRPRRRRGGAATPRASSLPPTVRVGARRPPAHPPAAPTQEEAPLTHVGILGS